MAGSKKAMKKKHPKSQRGRQLANAHVIEKSQKEKAAKEQDKQGR